MIEKILRFVFPRTVQRMHAVSYMEAYDAWRTQLRVSDLGEADYMWRAASNYFREHNGNMWPSL